MNDQNATANNDSCHAVGAPVETSVRPCAWVDERAISWLEARAGKAGAFITTPLAAKGPSHERPMPLYTVAALQAALFDALDCRTCAHYAPHHYGEMLHCAAPLRCVEASSYRRGGGVQLWEARPIEPAPF